MRSRKKSFSNCFHSPARSPSLRGKRVLTQYSSIPWPRPGSYMAPLIILMSRQGGPTFQHSNCERSELNSL
jgi:hypothetical protein